ncbi:calpastatin isoform X6 [Saccopteryx leptura]|uniref:calpastatin isoform X6 n=1 Tax=Saccopteryx leptura TaxID=249018 RepID=UPI00339BD14C
MAFASWWYKTQVYDKNSGSPSKSGENKGEDEKKATSHGSSQPSRIHAVGTASAAKVSATSVSTSKSSSMNPTETKAVKTEPEKKSQSTKPSEVHEKKTPELKPKEHIEPKSLPKHASDTGSKHAHKEKAVSSSSEQPTAGKSTKPKTKSQDVDSAAGKSAVAGVAMVSNKSNDKSDLDAALDDLIDTLGEPEETEQDNRPYTGPEVSDPMSSTYIEELGKRESTIPPKYRELLAKQEGVTGLPPDSSKPAGPDDAIDALSSDFTCSSPTAAGKKTEEEKSTGEVLNAQSARVIKSAAPPHENRRKEKEGTMSDQALEMLSASLGSRKSEPELDLSSIQEVDEAKAKEERLKKCGEDEETVPSEYRLEPATDRDGKPLLPEPEEKPKSLSESELIDELSEDFDQAKCKEKQSKPTKKTKESQGAAPDPAGEDVPQASACSIQAAPPALAAAVQGPGPEDAVEALAGSLGTREEDPEDRKPAEDKVKERAKEESREKLGEKEETIPPDYRLEEVKDKDGKPLLTKESKESLLVSKPAFSESFLLVCPDGNSPLSEDLLLDALAQDFTGSSSTSSFPFEDAKLSAAVSELVSQTPARAPHSSGPPPDTASNDKEVDDALDQLSDRLGHRQPDPDENKPIKDKVKEKAKAEHRDKLGERDDTIPPEYRHLLDNNDKSKPAKPPAKKPKKPADGKDPIDTLSGDFDSCPSTTESSENTAKDKDKKSASNAKAVKHGGKAKDSAKAKEETSKPKANEKKKS